MLLWSVNELPIGSESTNKEIMPLQYYGLGTLGRGRWAVAGMVTHGAHAYSRY